MGPERAPHRSYYYAMGLTHEEITQPLVGVASCWNEAAPCNIALSRQAQAAKIGVKEAGATPREFTTITVTDGIAMGHQSMKSSLASRDTIADSIELTMRGHCYDALVGIAGCDKSLPGVMMSMIRLNVPSVFMYGGSIMPGKRWASTPPAACLTRNWMSLNAMPAQARALAAANSPPIPWPAFRK
jgi:dihydroxy-acid dehydratase